MKEKLREWIHRGFGRERDVIELWISLQAREYPELAASRVLELGCGAGVLAGAFDPQRYHGIDSDPMAVAAACRRYPDYDFRVADLRSPETVPLFRDAAAVVCHGVLHHLNDAELERLLAVIVKATPPGASLLAIEPVLPPWTMPAGRLLASWDRGAWIRPASRLEELVTSSGLRLAESRRISLWPRYPIPSNAYRFIKDRPGHQSVNGKDE